MIVGPRLTVSLFSSIVMLFLVSTSASAQPATKFMGRQVTITEPQHDADGFIPNGSASVCVEGPPQPQCYKAPDRYGDATATVIQVEKGMPALFFSAVSRGVSGAAIHLALLRPGSGDGLDDLFLADTSVSNQSEHVFWTDAAISASPIFVTANGTTARIATSFPYMRCGLRHLFLTAFTTIWKTDT
jgi:hypothetical protein